MQLIEKEKALDFASLKNMAEKVEGSFCFTVLNDRNELYFTKGDNPLALYKFDGFYLYASTEMILQNALEKLNLSKYSKVNINCGDILKLDSNGGVEVGHFDFHEAFYGGYGGYFGETDEDYLEELSLLYGIDREDILTLLDYGFGLFDIEEMLCCPDIMRDYFSGIGTR